MGKARAKREKARRDGERDRIAARPECPARPARPTADEQEQANAYAREAADRFAERAGLRLS